MKTCRRCGVEKLLAEFTPIKRLPDGHMSTCRECRRPAMLAAGRRWQKRNAKTKSEWTKKWCQEHPESVRVHKLTWKANNLDRIRITDRARQQVLRATKSGALIRPDMCSKCGGPGPIEAAHDNYALPLKVTWLCLSCHRLWDSRDPKTKGRRN